MINLDQATTTPHQNPKPPGAAFRGLLVAAAALAGLGSFIIFVGSTPITPTHQVVVSVLLVDAAAIICLVGVVIWEIAPLIRRRREVEARTHLRSAMLLAVVAAIPAVLTAITAEIAVYRAFDLFLSRDVRELVSNSYYLAAEQARGELSGLGDVALQLSRQIGADRLQLDRDRQAIHQFLNAQSSLHHLPVVMLVKADGSVIDRSDTNGVNQPVSLPPLTTVSDNEPQLAMPRPAVAEAVIRLRGYDDAYLYVSRAIDRGTFNQIQAVQQVAEKYSTLQERHSDVQVSFALLFAAISLIGLLSTLWIGLRATPYVSYF